MPHLGIAVATTIGGWLNAVLLWSALRRQGHFVADARLKHALPMVVVSSLVMGAVLWLLAYCSPVNSRRAAAGWSGWGAGGLMVGRRRSFTLPWHMSPARHGSGRSRPLSPAAGAPRSGDGLAPVRPHAIRRRPEKEADDDESDPARLLRHAADRQPASRQLSRRHGALGGAAEERTSASTASSTCTRSRCGRIRRSCSDRSARSRRPTSPPASIPSASIIFNQSAGAGARGAGLGLQLRRAPRLAEPHDAVQGEGRQGSRERVASGSTPIRR